MAEAVGLPRPPRAVIFDLDGTLYRQSPVRRAMLFELLRGHLRHPRRGLRTMRALSAYRRAQEHLRTTDTGATEPVDLAAAQLALAASWSGEQPDVVAADVARWMDEAPLAHVAHARRPGLVELLDGCASAGMRLGVLSDYPAAAKLAALGVAERFDVVLTAQTPEVGVFKPHPRGLQRALQQLQVPPEDAVYVGDRPEVDGAAAAAAGLACAIVGARAARTTEADQTWIGATTFADLGVMLGLPASA